MTDKKLQEITPEIIRQAWEEGKSKMDEYVKEPGGISNALIRVLAINEKIRDTLLEGKTTLSNNALRQKYLNKVAVILELKKGGVYEVLRGLGENEFTIKKWKSQVTKRLDSAMRGAYHISLGR